MFSFPVTVPVRMEDEVYPLDLHVAIDDVAVVKPILDKEERFGVKDPPHLSLIPSTEIVLVDGRKLPVLETPATVNRYLDAYRSLEDFYTGRAAATEDTTGGVVIPLFQGGSCNTSRGSTPD